MIESTIDGKNAEYVSLAKDDGVWLYETSDAQDLVELVQDPGAWIGKLRVKPSAIEESRPPVLLDNFVLTMDVATSVDPDEKVGPTYVVDGIDYTGLITVRLATPGGRFRMKSEWAHDYLEAELLKKKLVFVNAQVGERCFVHVEIGQDPKLRSALLCAAVEDPAALCDFYNRLEHEEHDACGNPTKSGKRLTFRVPKCGGGFRDLSQIQTMSIVVQGTQSTWAIQDACNLLVGINEETFTNVGGMMIKSYKAIDEIVTIPDEDSED